MLATARANGLQQQMQPSNMYIDQAWVVKGVYLRGIRYHGKGMFGIMRRPRAQMRVILREKEPVVDGGKGTRRTIRGWKERKRVWTSLMENKPIYNAKGYYNW